jgi:hypothetical protein
MRKSDETFLVVLQQVVKLLNDIRIISSIFSLSIYEPIFIIDYFSWLGVYDDMMIKTSNLPPKKAARSLCPWDQ